LIAAKGKDDYRREGRKLRVMNYKDHHIEVSVCAAGSNGWMPDIFVSYSEHSKGVLKSLRMDQTFATPHEAEQAGLAFAQKWIDDGKPDP
jgi:hypothetical protein